MTPKTIQTAQLWGTWFAMAAMVVSGTFYISRLRTEPEVRNIVSTELKPVEVRLEATIQRLDELRQDLRDMRADLKREGFQQTGGMEPARRNDSGRILFTADHTAVYGIDTLNPD